MKRKILFLMLFTLFIVTEVYAEDYDFRKTNWGMSQKEVLASETSKPIGQNAEMIIYKCKILNKDVLAAYCFIQNKLCKAVYMLKNKHSNTNRFIKDYQDFKKTLTNKYGKPIEDETRWEKEFFKDEPSLRGMAVSMGHLTYYCTWETDSTEISLMLTGDNFKINCMMGYESKELKHLQEQKTAQKNIDDF